MMLRSAPGVNTRVTPDTYPEWGSGGERWAEVAAGVCETWPSREAPCGAKKSGLRHAPVVETDRLLNHHTDAQAVPQYVDGFSGGAPEP